jgi:predicted DNA-binding transcriptional regulator AlpA
VHHKFKDLTGRRFGMLIATAPAYSRQGAWYWRYKCDCGKVCVKAGSDVTKSVKLGGTPSCGCAVAAQIGRKNSTHGMSGSKIYIVWRNMRNRCNKQWEPAYKNYGARGIKVCKRWQDSFAAFWEDMGPTYRPGLTLERRNNDGDYAPRNCYWATYTQQARNTRSTIRSVNVPELSAQTGIGRTTLYNRLRAGWPVDKLTTPPAFSNRYLTLSTAAREVGS